MTASSPLLNFESLLAEIPGDSPAGSSVPFDIREKLEDFRKEDDPADYSDDDPMRPEKSKKSDWPGIINTCKDTLTKVSKDLLISARLTEALVRQNGFAGFRDGIHLLRLLVEQCWDRLNPAIESDDDLELRAAAFNWLDDPDRGSRFPNTLRGVPIVVGDEGRKFSWIDWKISQDNKGSVKREDFDKAIALTPIERCEAALQDLTPALEDLIQLIQVLSTKMGVFAPALTSVRQAVDDCRMLLTQIIRIKKPLGSSDTASADDADSSGASSAGATTSGAAPRPATSRAEAYRQLAQAAALLQQLEPHSPIPYLVQRAVELGSLPFPKLIKELVREPNILGELYREMGIKSEAPPPAP